MLSRVFLYCLYCLYCIDGLHRLGIWDGTWVIWIGCVGMDGWMDGRTWLVGIMIITITITVGHLAL